jgi:hypothetical protein
VTHVPGERLPIARPSHGPQTPVLAMGDFNDEPFDTSLVRHALTTRQRAKVTSAREEPLFWNVMWPIVGAPDGSFYFDNQPNMLDQLLVNKNMAIGDAPIRVDPTTAQILRPPAMVNPDVYPKPIRRRNGQAGQSKRILRPLPDHHDGHRGRLGRLPEQFWRDPWHRPVTSAAVWTRQWGGGRIFVSTPGDRGRGPGGP